LKQSFRKREWRIPNKIFRKKRLSWVQIRLINIEHSTIFPENILKILNLKRTLKYFFRYLIFKMFLEEVATAFIKRVNVLEAIGLTIRLPKISPEWVKV